MIRLVRLACSHALRRKSLSIVAIAISAVMAGAIATLIGSATQRSNDLIESLRDPKARSVVIRSTKETSRISRTTAAAIASLPGVELAVGLPDAVSVTAAGLRDPNASAGYIPIEVLDGEPPIEYTTGRPPLSGEVAISQGAINALRMAKPLATGVTANEVVLPIVATFTIGESGAVSDLLANAVIGPSTNAPDYLIVALLAREPSDVATITATANRLVFDRDSIRLDYEPRAADIQQSVADAGRRNIASLAITVVIVGALVQLASSLLNALLQRRENARRRALGFTRADIVGLGAIEAAMLSAIGAAAGTAFGVARVGIEISPATWAQAASTVGFLILIAGLASLPGGAAAALQDPARILRVP